MARARAFRYRRGRSPLTTASVGAGSDEIVALTASALVTLLWDRLAVPIGLRAWDEYQLSDSFAALPRLCRFEFGALQEGLKLYLPSPSSALTLVTSSEPRSPMGWAIFMEQLHSG